MVWTNEDLLLTLRAFNKVKTVAEWLDDPICSVDLTELKRRLSRGWSPERALSDELEKPKKQSEYRGVYWHRGNRKWVAQIRHLGKLETIDYFDSEKEAARAYNKRAKQLLGSDARLNYVP